MVHKKKAEYDQAEPLFVRALDIIESVYGKNSLHPKTGSYLNDLADVLRKRGLNDQAFEIYQRYLKIHRKFCY